MAVPGHNRRVKRWFGALIAVVIACVPIVLQRAVSSDLLQDTDTKVLLATIRQRNAPLSWFTGDWPLQNHFYRPMSTLSFELDNRLYGSNAVGYGWTNALLCVACVLLLFWFLRELTDRPAISALGAVLFAIQHVGFDRFLDGPITALAILAALIGAVRYRFKVVMWLPPALVLLYAAEEVCSPIGFGDKTIAWLPGRTATVMTVFALIAMAAYARYERLSAQRIELEPKATDAPATRMTRAAVPSHRSGLPWAILSLGALALALASYEQAVMLPAVLLAVAVTLRCERFRVRWGWQIGFWGLLVAYVFLRREIIPAGVSHYQAQQLRSGPGVRISLLAYLLPFANGFSGFLAVMESGPIMLMTSAPYMYLLNVTSTLTAFYQLRRRWIWALAGYGMSIIAFLPMAWVKQFDHYNYWPMALRSLFTVMLLVVGCDLALSAWSPPTRQAPPRPDPAPGSLPRRYTSNPAS